MLYLMEKDFIKLIMDDIQVVVFSKNRAMQLDLCLHTFFKNCAEKVDINVLYTTTSENHENSYEILKKQYKNVSFMQEKSFKDDLMTILSNKKYILFVVDDAVFTNYFSLEKIINTLKIHNKTIGFSLRLGTNTNYNYPHDSLQMIPKFSLFDDIIVYQWTTGHLDFGYPAELSSSIYKIEDLMPLLEQVPFCGPNDLEWMLYINLGYFANFKPLLACFDKSVCFCNPLNKVQSVNENRVWQNQKYLSEELLRMFNEGYRINPKQFEEFVSNACHQEIELEFIKEESEF